MRIDADVHAIDHARFPDPALGGAADPLRKNYPPEYVERILRRNRFDGMVLVGTRDSLDETHWLVEMAERNPFILAVVGWVDLASPVLGHTLDELESAGRFRGVRAAPDSARTEGLRELARRGLPLQVDVPAADLAAVARLAEEAPGLRILVERSGNPDIAGGDLDRWSEAMSALAAFPTVSVKISGLVTRASPGWSPADLAPYVLHLFHTFGPQRLLYGSDWPFCLRAVDAWKKVLAAFTQALGAQSKEDRIPILGENAMEVYRIPSAPEARSYSPAP